MAKQSEQQAAQEQVDTGESQQKQQMDELGHPMNVDPEARSGFGDKLTDSIGDENISTAYPPENPTADAASEQTGAKG